MPFELYDSLSKGSSQNVNLEKLRAELAALDLEGQSFAFALIYYDAQQHGLEPPELKPRATIDLAALPKRVLRILAKFIPLHKQRMIENSEMSKAQQLFNK